MDDRKYLVYLITNMVNGKQYAGLTKGPHEKRWTQHKSSARKGSGTYLSAAIRKHGEDSFRISVMRKNLTKHEAEEEEKLTIRVLNLLDRNFGYNMTEGGEGITITPDVIQRMKDSSSCRRRDIRNEDIVDLYLEGKSHREIGNIFGVSGTMIEDRLRESGIPSRQRKRNDVSKDEVVYLYSCGNSMQKISEKLRISECGVQSRLKGTPIRSRERSDVSNSTLKRLYIEGWSTSQLASQFNMTRIGIAYRLETEGVERRPRGKSRIRRDRKFEDPSERIAYIQQIRSETEESR